MGAVLTACPGREVPSRGHPVPRGLGSCLNMSTGQDGGDATQAWRRRETQGLEPLLGVRGGQRGLDRDFYFPPNNTVSSQWQGIL